MNKMQHPSNNRVLGAPKGWDQKELPCDALPVTVCEFAGFPAVASYWTPTREELDHMNAGKPVVLFVLGQTMPPVALGVEA